MDEDRSNNNPRIKEARNTARGILKDSGISSAPVQINDIIPAVKKIFGDVVISPMPGDGFGSNGDALTQRRGENVFIIYNNDRPLVRKRFSVAHELGHLLFGHLHGNSSLDIGADSHDEQEADAFAAELLMPPLLLRQDVKSGQKDVIKLAKKYQVSEEAMWIQVKSSNLLKHF